MCGVTAVKIKNVKVPWAMPKLTQPSSLPMKQASIDPETLKELVEFQEIVTEGVPLLLKLFNRLMRNKFAKPLLEVLLTCDKQNFIVSCVQGIFQKVVGILAGQQNQARAQPNGNDGVNKKSHDHLQPHMKENQTQQSKSDEPPRYDTWCTPHLFKYDTPATPRENFRQWSKIRNIRKFSPSKVSLITVAFLSEFYTNNNIYNL